MSRLKNFKKEASTLQTPHKASFEDRMLNRLDRLNKALEKSPEPAEVSFSFAEGLLADMDPRVRAAAHTTMGMAASRNSSLRTLALQRMTEGSADPAAVVRAAALEVMRELAWRNPDLASHATVRHLIKLATRDPDPTVVSKATRAFSIVIARRLDLAADAVKATSNDPTAKALFLSATELLNAAHLKKANNTLKVRRKVWRLQRQPDRFTP